MSTIVLQAGSTFWFDYKPNPPARWVYKGSSFQIQSEDYQLYALVADELLDGKLDDPKAKTLVERVSEKVKEVLGLDQPKEPDAPPENTRYPCPFCSTVFKVIKGLEIHLRNAHPEPEVGSPEDFARAAALGLPEPVVEVVNDEVAEIDAPADSVEEASLPVAEADQAEVEPKVEESSEEDPAEDAEPEEPSESPAEDAESSVEPAEPEPGHQCPHCDRTFGTERGLQIHIGHIHENHSATEE